MTARLHAGLSLVAGALLAVIYSRAIDGLVSAPVLIVVLVVAHVAGRLAASSRFTTPIVTVIAAVAVLAARAAFLAALGALAGSSASVSLAALLQELDAGSIAVLPVLILGWADGLSAVRCPRLLRWAPLVHGVLLLALLWSQAHYELTYFDRPWAYVLTVGLILATDAFLLVDLSRITRRAALRTAALLAPIIALALLLATNWYSTGGTSAGGGILRPTLFRFDFAPFVQLESEITMSDDLVLLYRRSGRARRELLRRYVLTEYDSRGGFSVASGESGGRTSATATAGVEPRGWRERELVEQEFFLVNLDPQTRLALNEPVSYQPFRVWDDSSFTAAYAAQSLVSTAPPFRLSAAGRAELTDRELETLTDYGDREELRALALEIVDGVTGDFARARAIELYLQDNYFYSLRPGIAADGDQLAHFLFESRKGYCSYYAFSMALMVRSLGIPARVAVGFFVDPGQEVLNFYPVLANMAHAWVEVYLGEYGWVEFDPTSQTLAPGEEYEFGAGADPTEVARLLEEILAQDLAAAEEIAAQTVDEPEAGRLPAILRSAIRRWYLLLPLLYGLYLGGLHLAPLLGVARAGTPRERVLSRSRRALVWLSRWGLRRRPDESLREFGSRLDLDRSETLFELYERALFAPDVNAVDDTRSREATAACLRDLRRASSWWRTLLAVLDPRPHRVARHRRAAGSRTLVVAVLLFGATLLQPADANAQQTPDWYRDEAREAIRSERYDRAVDLLQEAQREHGATSEFFVRLGDLYYDEELYGLALDEYLEAELRDPTSYEVLEAIAFTLGLLNREDESAEYWFRIADLHPERVEPYQNLGWLLFKLHRLEAGRELALDAWDRFGPDADLAMTLGTIHAELYRFPEASSWYRRSIELASANESSSFVAVAFYNLSLIQKLFHRYEDALESTEESLRMLPRPTGYLARGELHELRMNFTAAHADYLRAYEMDDDTPLARLNLALLYRRFGRLEEALAFATSVVDEEENSSWLYYYGTDVRRHRMELHDLLADIHEGLSRTEGRRPAAGLFEWFERAWLRVRHRVLGWYHRARFRSLAGDVAERVLEGGNLIDGNWYLFRAQEGHRRVALEFLDRARRLEVSAIPGAAPFYAVEEATLHGDRERLIELAFELQGPWRAHLREEALVAALSGAAVVREPELRRAATMLYSINPGAFRQHTIDLPVRLSVDAERASDARRVRGVLARAGIRAVQGASPELGELRVEVTPGRVRATLRVGARLTTAEAARESTNRRATARAVSELADSLFLVE